MNTQQQGDPCRWHALEEGFVQRVVLKRTERKVVQASIHPRAVYELKLIMNAPNNKWKVITASV
jgi:hypothetical protein